MCGPEKGTPMKKPAHRATTGLFIAACCWFLASHSSASAEGSYPGWAAAVVPVYPHSLSRSGLVLPTIYNVATTDSFQAVVAWYKSRVNGAWESAEGGHTWQVKSGGIRIQISANYFDDSGNEKPGTRVAITKILR